MSCLSVSFGCHVSFYILISSESSKSSGGGILVSRIFSQLGDGGDGICGLCFFLDASEVRRFLTIYPALIQRQILVVVYVFFSLAV